MVWKTGVWLKHLFTFPSLFTRKTRVWEDAYAYVLPRHGARICLGECLHWGVKDGFQVFVMILLKMAVLLVTRFGFSGREPDCAVSCPSRCLKCTPQKAFWSLGAELCHWLKLSLFSGSGRTNGASSLTDLPESFPSLPNAKKGLLLVCDGSKMTLSCMIEGSGTSLRKCTSGGVQKEA